MQSRGGRPYPLGATVEPDGINFAVFSRNGTAVYIELFDAPGDDKPRRSIGLDPRTNRTGDVWHVFVPGVRHGQLYGVRVDGPYDPEVHGHRFNVNKLLLDPYARGIIGGYDGGADAIYGFVRSDGDDADLALSTTDSAPYTPRSVAVAERRFDWGDDRAPRVPLAESVFYEVHTRGFTAHPSSGVVHPGTYLGVAEKIDHLKRLGVTAVELLPVHHFNPDEPATGYTKGDPARRNYWGYSSLAFFTPHAAYRHARDPLAEVTEFKEMVKALHAAGIEVILDVVFNHTGEGDERGPTFSFRGLDNSVYYVLDGGRKYRNYSGCGNTVNCNHPVVKQLILDCLRYWLVEMRVDGFRFDLATILGRSDQGDWLGNVSLVRDIVADPVLRGCKLIAEAWDAGGMYKVGDFPRGWAEWNGRFRDDVRRLIRGDLGLVPDFARRLGGSRDLFTEKGTPDPSINFITAHDGFTLRDLVSYATKHNLDNGEDNRDGSDSDWSSNHGVEGETDDAAINTLRRRQAKNLLVALFVSRGTPMVLGGDELWRTKGGNNNTYCQDNERSWLDWTPSEASAEMLRFVQALTALRRRYPALRRTGFADPFAVDAAGVAGRVGNDVAWHGIVADAPDWTYHSRSLAMHVRADPTGRATGDGDVYVAFNAWTEPLVFALPTLPAPLAWHRVVDTQCAPPHDLREVDGSGIVDGGELRLDEQSCAVLVARPASAKPQRSV